MFKEYCEDKTLETKHQDQSAAVFLFIRPAETPVVQQAIPPQNTLIFIIKNVNNL